MSNKKNQIFFTSIPRDISKEDIRSFFNDCGEIKEITLKKGYGFVVCI